MLSHCGPFLFIGRLPAQAHLQVTERHPQPAVQLHHLTGRDSRFSRDLLSLTPLLNFNNSLLHTGKPPS
jgi:hypothetical protein